MAYYEDQKPRKNIFNVFQLGKSFFFTRVVVEMLGFLAVLFGVIVLWKQSTSQYATVVRDPSGHVFVGKTSDYSPTLQEAITLGKDIVETLMTRADRGSVVRILQPYISDAALGPFISGSTNTNARVTGMFLFVAAPTLLNPDRVGMVLEINLYTWTATNTTNDTAYMVLQLQRDHPTPDNPTGWRVAGIANQSRAFFLEQLTAVWRNPKQQYLKKFNTVLIPDYVGDVNLKQLLDKSSPIEDASQAKDKNQPQQTSK